MLALLLVASGACQRPLYEDYRIPNASMEPTFGRYERVTVRVVESGDDLQRGDIIVFRQPGQEHKKYMKRVVGLAGDSVEVTGNSLFVNGETLLEPYAKYTRPIQPAAPVSVPPDAVFVLGDNRANSLDSRHFGCVPLDNLIGVVAR